MQPEYPVDDPMKPSPDRPIVDGMTREQLEQLFLAEMPMIRRLIGSIARRQRLSAADADEFTSEVHLRIIYNDYAILRKFRGGSTLRTFLTVVIQRLFLDYRNAQWGKWRPSARSRRAGDVGVLFERLIIRDGMTFDEACSHLEMIRAGGFDHEALARVYAGMQQRGRPRLLSKEAGASVPSEDSADDSLVRSDHQRVLAQAIDVLGLALRDMPAVDYVILKCHFGEGLAFSTIARRLKLDQKRLYRRATRLLKQLRTLLESAGTLGADVLPAVGRRDADPASVFSRR